MKKIVVVGGVAGGASFAARMRRLDEHAEITMFDKGEYISFANCGLPYHVGGVIKERDNLIIQTPQKFKQRFNVDVAVHHEVVTINRAEKTVTVRADGKTFDKPYDYLVLAPGAMPVRPPVPGMDSKLVHTVRTIPDIDKIQAVLSTAKVDRAVVIGGGFIGLEMAENLRMRGVDVTLVEMVDQVFAPADPEMAVTLHQHLTINGVQLLFNHGVTKIIDDGNGTAQVVLDNNLSVPAQLIILAIGVKPDTAFLKDSGINLNERGAIIVDESMRTNDELVYAVGDAVEVYDFVSNTKTMVPLAGPANRQGRIAADAIAGIPSTYKKTQGTAICKIFDLTAAVTGINEKTARRLKIPYAKSYTHSASHATYYPGAFPLSIKLLFDPASGVVLGAQIIGKDGVDKRIDLFAMAVRHRLTVDELSELELAYAPPYGSAKDPVNIAGFVAQNIREKRMPVFYAEDVAALDPSRQILLDVRTRGEYEQASIPGAVLIPVDSLRDQMDALDKQKEILVYCQVGLRGHLATRILLGQGFAAKNLSGGYKTWLAMNAIK